MSHKVKKWANKTTTLSTKSCIHFHAAHAAFVHGVTRKVIVHNEVYDMIM